jgi:hypothetical protein
MRPSTTFVASMMLSLTVASPLLTTVIETDYVPVTFQETIIVPETTLVRYTTTTVGVSTTLVPGPPITKVDGEIRPGIPITKTIPGRTSTIITFSTSTFSATTVVPVVTTIPIVSEDVYFETNDASASWMMCAYEGSSGGSPWTACGVVTNYNTPESSWTVTSDFGPSFLCAVYAYGDTWSSNGLSSRYFLSGNYLGLTYGDSSVQLSYSSATISTNSNQISSICNAAFPDSSGDLFLPNSNILQWNNILDLDTPSK